MRKVFFLGALWGALAATGASAATIDPAKMMATFNVISLGDLTASSETEGTVYVGGNLTSNGYGVNPDELADGTVGGVTDNRTGTRLRAADCVPATVIEDLAIPVQHRVGGDRS